MADFESERRMCLRIAQKTFAFEGRLRRGEAVGVVPLGECDVRKVLWALMVGSHSKS